MALRGRPSQRDKHAEFIKNNLGRLTEKEMARIIGVAYQTVSRWIKKYGVPDRRRKVNLTTQEAYLRENARTKTREQMAVELNVHVCTISRCLRKLGISTKKSSKGRNKQ
jgi:transposase